MFIGRSALSGNNRYIDGLVDEVKISSVEGLSGKTVELKIVSRRKGIVLEGTRWGQDKCLVFWSCL